MRAALEAAASLVAALFKPAGGAILRALAPASASPAAQWKAAIRQAKRQARLARQLDAITAQAERQPAEKAKAAAPRRPDGGSLYDGKELRDNGGRVVGHWRYRGGRFQADYFAA